MRSSTKVFHLTAGLLLLAALTAAPATARSHLSVVHPGESIQDAVDAASPGDTIVVYAGTYHESVSIQTDGITLRAKGRVILRPPANGSGLCNIDEEVGICVVPADIDFDTSSYTDRVTDVTIIGLHVLGFEGDGIYGLGTMNLTVSGVRAFGNEDYGVASFDGVGTTFVKNRASGSHDAGIYIGDSPHANAVVMHNRSWDNALGVLVRHARDVLVSDNRASRNCLGIFLLDDGQEGGSGDIAVLDNRVAANNHRCTNFAEFLFTPVIAGGGIVAAGSQHNVIAHNTVHGNRGTTIFSGGIVLVATTRASADGTFAASTGNVVTHNYSSHNRPADIVEDDASRANVITGNRCHTSIPDGLCHHS
jgi:nitrous oxidase accessory protein NosD